MKGFLNRVKRFILFIFFIFGLACSLILFSLSEEESYKKSCKEFGLECSSKSRMQDSVLQFRVWFADQCKYAETLEIGKFFDFTKSSSDPEKK